MLKDEDYIKQSLTTNLFYLRTIREFCANLGLSFYQNNKEYIDRMEELAKRCERLGAKWVSYADGNISAETLQYQIFVTDYTYPLEELTEKLFGISINKDITRREGVLKPGTVTNPDAAFIESVTKANEESLQITNDFLSVCEEILEKMQNNELFSYSYPALISFMIHEAEIYKNDLMRLLSRDTVDPIYAINNEFWYNNEMLYIISFLKGFIDPSHNEEIEELDRLQKEFYNLANSYKKTTLSPDTQIELTKKSITLVNHFHDLLKELIEGVLNKRIYFIVEPLFLDNMYTEVNYFRYILNQNLEKQKVYVEG